jgi:hypothetical protein
VRRILAVLALVAPAGCAIVPAYPPPSVIVGPSVVRVYPLPHRGWCTGHITAAVTTGNAGLSAAHRM